MFKWINKLYQLVFKYLIFLQQCMVNVITMRNYLILHGLFDIKFIQCYDKIYNLIIYEYLT